MKERLQNWITTIIGALIMLLAVVLYVMEKFYDFEIGYLEMAAILVLGWVFLTARDTLLEGLFLNLFKIKKKEDEQE